MEEVEIVGLRKTSQRYDSIRLEVADNGIILSYSIYDERPKKSESGWVNHQILFGFDKEAKAYDEFEKLYKLNFEAEKKKIMKQIKNTKKP